MRWTIAELTDRSIRRGYRAPVDWADRAEEASARYRGGETRDADQRQLTQLANSAWAAGLCLLMAGEPAKSREWLLRAAERYRESWVAGAPADSWGRPIAAMKSLLLAGDDATPAARWALAAGAADAQSVIGRYAGTLALLVLGDDAAAFALGATLRDRDDFPQPVAAGLVALAAADAAGYRSAAGAILASFEERSDFLEDVPVADTVLVLQALAAARSIAADLPTSARLP
jgi:hypothetical protein